MKILIIEDEKSLSHSIGTYLANELYTCEYAYSFSSALEKISINDYSCIVLDINLPDGSGLSILKDLKADNKMDGVLIISANNSLGDKISGLNAGADDYLTKPFDLPELCARISAIIRRKHFQGNNKIVIDNMVVDLQEKSVKVNEIDIELTRKEYELLIYFISNKNRVISKIAIVEHLWGDNVDITGNFDSIYTHLKNLRKKIMEAGSIDYIKTIHGIGYKFVGY